MVVDRVRKERWVHGAFGRRRAVRERKRAGGSSFVAFVSF
jgi:hypothetical protein